MYLAKAYEKVDPLAVLPILSQLVYHEVETANAHNYRYAARRLAKMRKLAQDTDMAAEVDTLITELRETHRRGHRDSSRSSPAPGCPKPARMQRHPRRHRRWPHGAVSECNPRGFGYLHQSSENRPPHHARPWNSSADRSLSPLRKLQGVKDRRPPASTTVLENSSRMAPTIAPKSTSDPDGSPI